MYWLTKVEQQDTERTLLVTLDKAETERWLGLLFRSGFYSNEIRTIHGEVLEEGVNGNHKKLLKIHSTTC
jgi:hypothetical protein